VYVNAPVLVTEPEEVVRTTSFAPTVPAGVVIVTVVDVTVPTVAAAPPTVTLDVPVKFVPVMTVDVPPVVAPLVTDNEVIVGPASVVVGALIKIPRLNALRDGQILGVLDAQKVQSL
jgi:hypothetical protein